MSVSVSTGTVTTVTSTNPPTKSYTVRVLDEGLAIINALWSGRPVACTGTHYTVNTPAFAPTPLQRPRIPIWVAGRWPGTKPFRRAAQWDGVFPLSRQDDEQLSPEQYQEMLRYMQHQDDANSTFDVVTLSGPADATAPRIKAYTNAGVNWWQIGFLPDSTLDEVQQTIRRGPPPY